MFHGADDTTEAFFFMTPADQIILLYPIPIGSMYAIYGNIYHQYTPNVSIYTIHGSYGILQFFFLSQDWSICLCEIEYGVDRIESSSILSCNLNKMEAMNPNVITFLGYECKPLQ